MAKPQSLVNPANHESANGISRAFSGDQGSNETLLDQIGREAIEKAFLIRRVEQTFLQLFSEGRLFGTVHTCIGQELIGVAVAQALRTDDWIFSNHRCHGHFIAKTDLVEGLIAEVMGKETGVCGGWGGSQHLCARRFFSNGVQGGIVPVAAGLALAEKLRGTENIAVVFIGEGTLGEGVIYEASNVAARWSLPLLIVLENNHYSQSTPQEETLAGDIAARFAALNIQCLDTNGWDARGLFQTTREAVEYVRGQKRPAFVRVETYRLMAHSKGDDDRDPQEVRNYWEKDLLETFHKNSPCPAEAILTAVDVRVQQAVAAGLVSPYAQVRPEQSPDSCDLKPVRWHTAPVESKERMGQAIGDCFARRMEMDERIVMLGEDIRSPYGGAFKATRGLSDKFPERVRNMPISEAAIVGIGNGLALNGMRPVCEIMFGDFLTLACDQIINHASKFPRMYNGQVQVPLIIRTPMGGGRGYGPTHSQSLEKHFLGLPQTWVLALHERIHPATIYDRLFDMIDRLTLVIENKLMYARRLSPEVPDGFVLEHSDEPFPTTRLRPGGQADVTVVCYGGNLPLVEEAVLRAFDEHEIIGEIICPTRLYPMNAAPMLESVLRTGRLVVVEEGHGFAAWGAELIARLCEACPGVPAKVVRCAMPAHPIPSSGPLEKALLPNPNSILENIRGICARV